MKEMKKILNIKIWRSNKSDKMYGEMVRKANLELNDLERIKSWIDAELDRTLEDVKRATVK